MTDEQRELIRRIRAVVPDASSEHVIEEVVCGYRRGFDRAQISARTMADYQALWHNAPEGTNESKRALRSWDAKAERELANIKNGMIRGDSESVIPKLRDLFYNSPPGGTTRRLISGLIPRCLV